MWSSNILRWGAIATMLTGVFLILIDVFSIPSFGFPEQYWVTNLLESARFAVALVGLVGLYLYLRRSSRFGRLRTVGFYMLIAASVPGVIIYLGLALNEGVWKQWYNAFGPIYVFLTVVGAELFAVAILRAGSLPRVGAWLWIVAIPIFLFAVVASTAAPGGSSLSNWANWAFIVAGTVFGLGWIILGYGLWLHRDEPVQPATVR
jgi:hypothetical protein